MRPTIIVWLRRELRIRDNPALYHACQQGVVVPVYIVDELVDEAGQASRWYLHRSLDQLSSQLQNKLLLIKGSVHTVLSELVRELGANRIYYNRAYSPGERRIEQHLAKHFANSDIELTSFQASVLWEPDKVFNKQGLPYKVFTPFYRKGCLAHAPPRMPFPSANLESLASQEVVARVNGVSSVDELEPGSHFSWTHKLSLCWVAGEQAAAERLQAFLESHISEYTLARDVPALKGTSRLSAALHFGEVSPNQVWYAALQKFDMSMSDKNLDCFLSELAWREFSYYLLYHFPALQQQNFNARFDGFAWKQNPDQLATWEQGKTGVPIVDAGMRELWQTGFMHNRVRMIVASFLVKNLLIDWRKGEAWFRDCLVDADEAVNAASWQWVAGCGADAAPYFRVFNPVLQGKKFDADGEYVRTYCPELSTLPAKYIHCPWEAPETELEKAGLVLGRLYPWPIADIKASRERALENYAKLP